MCGLYQRVWKDVWRVFVRSTSPSSAPPRHESVKLADDDATSASIQNAQAGVSGQRSRNHRVRRRRNVAIRYAMMESMLAGSFMAAACMLLSIPPSKGRTDITGDRLAPECGGPKTPTFSRPPCSKTTTGYSNETTTATASCTVSICVDGIDECGQGWGGC